MLSFLCTILLGFQEGVGQAVPDLQGFVTPVRPQPPVVTKAILWRF